jgi:hypothetical protein
VICCDVVCEFRLFFLVVLLCFHVCVCVCVCLFVFVLFLLYDSQSKYIAAKDFVHCPSEFVVTGVMTLVVAVDSEEGAAMN